MGSFTFVGVCDVVRSGVHVVVVNSLLCVGDSIGNYVRIIVIFHSLCVLWCTFFDDVSSVDFVPGAQVIPACISPEGGYCV